MWGVMHWGGDVCGKGAFMQTAAMVGV